MKEKYYISIILPVFNEEGALPGLIEKIKKVSPAFPSSEVIFVNDGSTDNSLKILKKIKGIKIINFRKNFGQSAALDAGIKLSQGKYIATMDSDGQNDPSDIPLMLEKLKKKNLDMVSGWRKNRKDPFLKKISSLLMAKIRHFLINDGVHDSGCTLKVYRRYCFDSVDITGEMHRFIPALLKIKGFKIGEAEVRHYPRQSGYTKYNWRRGIKGNLDLISVWFWQKFANRPLHLFGSIGFLIILFSFFAFLWLIYKKIFHNLDLSNTALTSLALFSFLIGVQFLVFGLLADMLSKTYYSATKDKIYDIKEFIDNEKN